MLKRFAALSIFALGIFSTPSHAIEPTTVMAAASIAATLFSKDGGNPSVDLLKANRELLVGLHHRLDTLEATMAKALTEIVKLPQEMFTQNLAAESYNLGAEIVGIGEKYLEKVAALKIDRRQLGEDSPVYRSLQKDFRTFLVDNVDAISEKTRNLMQRENSTNINALSVIIGAYIELAMRIELQKNHQGSAGDVYISAETYSSHIDQILNSEESTSLVALLDESKRELFSNSVLNSWVKLPNETSVDAPNLRSLSGSYLAMCRRVKGTQGYVGTCYRTVRENSSIRGDEPMEYTVPYSCAKSRQTDVENSIWVVSLVEKEKMARYPIFDWNIKEIELSKTNHTCESLQQTYLSTAEALVDLNRKSELISENAKIVTYLNAILDSTNVAQVRIKEVSNGNFDEISVTTISSSLMERVGEVQLILNDVANLEAERGSSKYVAAMVEQRKQINALIASQDESIRKSFRRAADAAKWNQTLGYLKGAASLYGAYKQWDSTTSDREKVAYLKNLETARDGIISDMGRSPANELVLGSIDSLLENAAWWGGLINTKRQMAKLELAKETIRSTLPVGVVKKYDIIAVGNEFWGLLDSDDFQLRKPEYTTLSTIELSGGL